MCLCDGQDLIIIIIILLLLLLLLLGTRGQGFPPATMIVAPSYFHRKTEEK